MTNPITVLIVDDHAVVRQGVRAALEAREAFTVVGEAESGAEAVRRVADVVPDVVLMDLLMPDIDGVEATRQIKRLSPRTQVVVLTSHHDDEHIFPALRDQEALNPFTELTDRELEILKLLATGMTNHEITTHLVISEHTVKGHVSNILSKLHLGDRTQAAVFAWREGVVRRE